MTLTLPLPSTQVRAVELFNEVPCLVHLALTLTLTLTLTLSR